MITPQSSCCNAPIKFINTDEGTGYMLCIKCEKACDYASSAPLSVCCRVSVLYPMDPVSGGLYRAAALMGIVCCEKCGKTCDILPSESPERRPVSSRGAAAESNKAVTDGSVQTPEKMKPSECIQKLAEETFKKEKGRKGISQGEIMLSCLCGAIASYLDSQQSL